MPGPAPYANSSGLSMCRVYIQLQPAECRLSMAEQVRDVSASQTTPSIRPVLVLSHVPSTGAHAEGLAVFGRDMFLPSKQLLNLLWAPYDEHFLDPSSLSSPLQDIF